MQIIRIKIINKSNISLKQIMKTKQQYWLIAFLSLFFLYTIPKTQAAQNLEPQRIISAGGSITEILFALDLQDKLVAVDSTSLFPPAVHQLPKVGYFRSLGAEGLMSLNPDLIITAKGAGPDAVLKQVQQLGVEVKSYEESVYTLPAWKQLITNIGNDHDRSTQAEQLIERVSQNLNSHLSNKAARPINAIALLSIGQRGPVVAGKNTVPNLLFELTGINNLAADIEGYKPFSNELLAQQKLDLVLIPSHVIAGLGGKESVCENETLKLAMGAECKVHIMDALLLMGFGSRIDQAAAQIMELANL